MKVLVLLDCGQVVEDGLELVFLDPVAHQDELLDEEEHERPDGHDLIFRWTWSICGEKNSNTQSKSKLVSTVSEAI